MKSPYPDVTTLRKNSNKEKKRLDMEILKSTLNRMQVNSRRDHPHASLADSQLLGISSVRKHWGNAPWVPPPSLWFRPAVPHTPVKTAPTLPSPGPPPVSCAKERPSLLEASESGWLSAALVSGQTGLWHTASRGWPQGPCKLETLPKHIYN